MQNCRQLFIVFIMLFTLSVSTRYCLAIPSQFGDTGLVSQPTAETLNSGNICVGIIANCAENDGKTATVLPVFMTLGLGSFLEAYGSYPNILFNEDEEASGRGFSNVGFKIRVLGKRSSQFKLGLDGQLRRTVSGNINYDGLTDQVYRAIASYNNGTFGLHGNAGYIKPESPQYITYDNQIIYGGGLEYLPNSRLRLITEIGIESSKSQGLSDRAEVTAGFQYFLSPHLTLNIALAKGFSDESPDWRALFGFSSCQGVGTYQRPIPRKIAPEVEPVEESVEKKVLKVRTLTPLAPKKRIVPDNSSSKYEVPVGEQAEVVTLSPASAVSSVGDVALAGGAVSTAAANASLAISSGIPLLQVAPEMAGSVSATALALPVNDLIALPAQRPARSYKLNDVIKTDENQIVGKKIVEDLRYAAQFYSIAETPTNFTAVFYHRFDKPLEVWIEGPGKTSAQLSKSRAAPYEEITLTIDKVNGKIPYFKLHLGELSEVFEFFPLRKSVKLGKIEINVKPVVDEFVGEIASDLTAPVAPEVGPIAASASAATPSAGVAAAPTTTSAPSSASVLVGDKASAPAAAATSAPSAGRTPPSAGSSATATSASAAPVVGNVAAKLSSTIAPEAGVRAATVNDAAPSAGAIPFTDVVRPPKSGSATNSSQVAGPVSGPLTTPDSATTAPAAGLTKTAPTGTTTPDGATVILLNSGVSPVPEEIATAETLTVRPPVSGSLAAVPTKTVQAVAYKKFRLPSTVIFAFDDATLTEEGKAAITDVVTAITTEKRWYVLRVDGFTDGLGSDDYNIKLGLRRAISVASYMVTNNGIDPSIVFVKSSGENEPLATNETEEGRSLNRRAEIVLFVQKDE
jgi:outer membrane protein OmpA-like peptidoglycan-associated protein